MLGEKESLRFFDVVTVDELAGWLQRAWRVSRKAGAIMRKLHEQDANQAFLKALTDGESTGLVMLDFLANAITAQNEIRVFDIGFPAFHYKHEGHRQGRPTRVDS